MKKRSISPKKFYLCGVLFLLFVSFQSYGQSYLPLTGGTLSGNLNLNPGTQLQASYYGLNSFFAQPANSSNIAMFANSTTGTTDLVGAGWRFIPSSSSSYLPAVFSIDGSGNTTVMGNAYVAKNFSVGTISPAALIHVLGATEQLRIGYDASNFSSLTMSGTGALTISNTGSSPYTFIKGSLITGTSSSNLYIASTTGAVNTAAAGYQFGVSTNTYFRTAIGGTASIPISTTSNYSGLNVAASPFTVAAGINVPFAASTVINPIGAVTLNAGATVSNTATLYIDGSANTPSANNYALYSAGAAGLNYFAGYVAINTPTIPSGYQFAVNGSMIATSVVVKQYPWPDYVFKKGYQIPSLTDVSNYIKLNHHLPEMPSAKDVVKNGLNLGEMNKLLTKKVEELTLYMIDKDRQITEDETKIKAQNERINKLEKAVQLLIQKDK